MSEVGLPKLPYLPSPNQSLRLAGVRPYLVVIHRPVGAYVGSRDWLRNPRSQASAHVIHEGRDKHADVATQLVPWDRKAWACMSFNSVSYNLEIDDDAWTDRERDVGAFHVAARITAFLCRRTGIPPHTSKRPLHDPGVVSHYMLGQAGGGHTDPTTNPTEWRKFMKAVQHEYERGHFRDHWGRGKLVRV
jgi:hypothetical protein